MYIESPNNTVLSDTDYDRSYFLQVRNNECKSHSNPSYCSIYKYVNMDAFKKRGFNESGSKTYSETYSYNFVADVLNTYIDLVKKESIPYYGSANNPARGAIAHILEPKYGKEYASSNRTEAVLYAMYLGHKYGVVSPSIYRPAIVKQEAPKKQTESTNNKQTNTVETTNSSNELNFTDEKESTKSTSTTQYIMYGVGGAIVLFIGAKILKLI